MKAVFKTKSDYGNLNGKELDVIEIARTRISCRVFSEEYGRMVTIDFTLTELVKFVGAAKFDIQLGEIGKHTPQSPVNA